MKNILKAFLTIGIFIFANEENNNDQMEEKKAVQAIEQYLVDQNQEAFDNMLNSL